MVAVDTNVLVRLITRDDDRQIARVEAFIRNGAWVSILTLDETMWVLSTTYKRGSKELTAAVEGLLNHKHLSVQEPEVVTAALSLFRSRPSLEFSDCLMLQLARKAGHLPLGTFDCDLAKVDGTQRL